MSERARLAVEDGYADYTEDAIAPPAGPDFAVFVDFAGLWQKERSDEQDASFGRGLASMDLLYAHQETAVLRMTRTLEGYDALPYGSRGWPFFETTVSQLIKPAHLSLDLGTDAAKAALTKFEGRPKAVEALAGQGRYWGAFVEGTFAAFKGVRAPPLAPAEFERRAAAMTVTNGKDKGVLIELQAKVATAVLGGVQELSYLQLGWGVAEVRVLAQALPMCAELRSLDLRGNSLAHGGAAALAGALAIGAPNLTALSLRDCKMGATEMEAIATVLRAKGSLMKVDIGSNNIGRTAALELIGILKQKKMVSVGLAGCNLGSEGAATVADYVRGSASLTELDLRDNNLRAEGAKALAMALAPAIAGSASLTSCDVRSNAISGKGASQLAAAVLNNTKLEKFNELPIKEMRADSLTTLNMTHKHIGVEGALVVAGLVPLMGSVTKLDLRNNKLQAEGAKALAPAIAGSSSLTKLNVMGNMLGADSKAALQDAVRNKEGFKLHI